MIDDNGTPPRTGLRIGWLVFALLALALAASGWFILAERADNAVAGRPTLPTVLGGAGSIAASPTQSPTQSSTQSSRATRPSGTARGREDTVTGVGTVRTIVCTDDPVSINGVHNTVTLNGRCSRVEVSGVENTVTVDAAEAIDVSGIRNRVIFRSGAPELTKSGIDNTVERG